MIKGCNFFIAVLLANQFFCCVVDGSLGERTNLYQECRSVCINKNCSTDADLKKFHNKQPLSELLLCWSCENECSYDCMWKTVEVFLLYNKSIPQFHGKWPFVRLYGIQEPASMMFSIMNGIAHLLGMVYFVSMVKSSNPMYTLSVTFGVLAVNIWICSTLFHTRDFPITEKLDYFSATAGILYSFYFCIHRISMGLDGEPSSSRGSRFRRAAFFLIFSFFGGHVSYLSFRKFDYGYNLMILIATGLCNGIIWLFYHWTTRQIFSHQWKATSVVLLSTALVNLELMDFPPLFWILDAHSIWHASTIPFPILWYSFLIDESRLFEYKKKSV